MKEEFELVAKTFHGLEEILAKELTELGASNIEIGNRMVAFTGDKALMYKANFCLRTAIRILKPIKHFKANTADEVYDNIKSNLLVKLKSVLKSLCTSLLVIRVEKHMCKTHVLSYLYIFQCAKR